MRYAIIIENDGNGCSAMSQTYRDASPRPIPLRKSEGLSPKPSRCTSKGCARMAIPCLSRPVSVNTWRPSKDLFHRAVNTIPLPMRVYEPSVAVASRFRFSELPHTP